MKVLSQEEQRKRMELYMKGLNDREISELCGVSTSTISHWRNRKHLPPNLYKREKSCVDCGKKFIARSPKAIRCKECRKIKESIFFTLREVRRLYRELSRVSPEKAIELYREMLREEGGKFTELALDGLPENVIKRNKAIK